MSKTDISRLLSETYSGHAKTRSQSVRQLCPCDLKSNIPEVWERLLEMVDDPDPGTRYQVLHVLCDGSPRALAPRVLEALDKFRNDPVKRIRRNARKALGEYSRTGRLDVL